jgi:outer membrane protein assembly factor BamA
MRFYLIYILLIFLLPKEAMCSQLDKYSNSDTTKIKNQFLAYPVVFYLPETRWGFGAAGLYNFRFRSESAESNPSQIQLIASYTQNKQLIFVMPFELYRKYNTWKIKGELTYFRYQFNAYGIGFDTKAENKEIYRANAPRVRIDVLKRYKKTFLGMRFAFDRFSMDEIKTNGILEQQSPVGLNGGINAGIGLLAHSDERNFIFNPTKGHYVEMESFFSNKITGSDFNFFKLFVNASKYIKLSENHTLVGNINTVFTQGKPPFFDMPFFGTPRIMRGYQDRRFMDKNMLVLQAEYRFPLYKRLHGVGFISTGTVGKSYASLFTNPYQLAHGAGLRFIINKKDRVRLRLDYGLTPSEGGAFYLTINDAF